MLAKVIVRKCLARGFGDAVRYIARDNPDQAAEPSPEMGALNLDCPLDTPEDRQTAIDILDATAAAARNTTARGPVYHVTLAWQEAEHPERPQIDAACTHVMKTLGFEGRDALWALHRDTDHDHVHLIVNRVHADGHTAKVPKDDWLLLDKAMREIEIAQGWRHSPGPYVVTHDDQDTPIIAKMSRAERFARGRLEDGPRLTNAAKAAEHRNAGAQSFQAWLAGEPAQGIRAAVQSPGASWHSVHQAAARYGVTIQPKGSGMVVTTTLDDGRVMAAKASQMGRWASKAPLEKTLGSYEPSRGPMPEPKVTYAAALDGQRASIRGEPQHASADPERLRRRVERAQARALLAARFKMEQEAIRKQRQALRKAMTARHRDERQALQADIRSMRADAIAAHKRSGLSPQLTASHQAGVAAGLREALQKRQAAERKELSAKTARTEVWRTWLERQAEMGDEVAQEAAKAALRGIRYREQRAKNKGQDGIEGEELDPLRKLTVAALQVEIDHRRQLVIYRGQDGKEKFTDTGPRIVMHDKASDSLEAALRIASQKYGGKVDITGSSEFRERIARQAARLGIKVVNDDLQAIVTDEQARQHPQRMRAQVIPEQERQRPVQQPQVETRYVIDSDFMLSKSIRATDAQREQARERIWARERAKGRTEQEIAQEYGFDLAPAQRPAASRPQPPTLSPETGHKTPRAQAEPVLVQPSPSVRSEKLAQHARELSAMEQAFERWLDGRPAGAAREFMNAHDRAVRNGAIGRKLIDEITGRAFQRHGAAVESALKGLSAEMGRQRERERGVGR